MRTRPAHRLISRLALALTLAAPAAAVAATSATAADGNATVTVVHGIPDTPVDVYVDGSKALSGFTFKTVTAPISLPAGAHAIAVRKAGDPASAAPILTANPSLPAGANATVVANLTAAGKPTLTPFVNPTSSVPDGMARVVVRHTAAAPAVDVLAGGKAVISGLSNPNEKMLMVPAGSLSVSVAAAGTTTPVIGPVPLDLASGSTTIVYAVGSLADKNLTAVAQTYSGSGRAPSSVNAGSGGLAADSSGVGLGAGLAGFAGAALLLGFGLSLRRSGAARR